MKSLVACDDWRADENLCILYAIFNDWRRTEYFDDKYWIVTIIDYYMK